MSKITIRAGDEYRARIAMELKRDTFFWEIYESAKAIVRELESHENAFRKREEAEGIQYRIGNNIIAFCGKRGHGKTSAMQTFSYYLRQHETKYYVLESIDPSALRADESIVRILISKLFNEVDKIVKNYARNSQLQLQEKYEEIRTARDGLLKCFETCFRNVDYSVKDNKDDFGMDDLELLSQLGSSNMLREKLQELIRKFLDFQSKFYRNGEERKDVYRFLVVQIDDADMALDGVFKTCEDIRNYFSLPNVIVLMAADMEQLKNAILQEYIKKYHDLIAAESDLQNREYHINNCNQMANRYIEKMFPAGHRIELPQIQDNIKWNFNTITLEYWEDGRDLFEGYSKIDPGRMHMQEQLLKMLYDRTGMIFLKNEENLHPILPRTMRELTHFIKMLKLMPEVEFEMAFEEMCGHTKVLQANLGMFENYFFDYWCANHLVENEQIVLRSLHEEVFKREPGVNEILSKLKEVESRTELHNALIIFYTIFLNKKFVEAVGKQELCSRLALYLEKFILEWDTKELRFMRYDFSCLSSNKTNVGSQTNLIFAAIDENDKGIFDAPGVILRALYEYDRLNRNMSEIENIHSIQDSMETVEDKYVSEDIGCILELKNSFANVEVYQSISEKISLIYCDAATNVEKLYTLAAIYQSLFESMILKEDSVKYLNIRKNTKVLLDEYWYELYSREKSPYANCFWNNCLHNNLFEKLREKFMHRYKQGIAEACDKVLDYIQQEDWSQLIYIRERGANVGSYDEIFKNSEIVLELVKKEELLKKLVQEIDRKIKNYGELDKNYKVLAQERITEIRESVKEKIMTR